MLELISVVNIYIVICHR